jgi:hypothetical protein
MNQAQVQVVLCSSLVRFAQLGFAELMVTLGKGSFF